MDKRAVRESSEEIQEVRDLLRDLSEEEAAVIVEGPKDKAALESYGVDKIFMLSKTPLFATIERVAKSFDRIIVLTDFDRKGKELYGKITKEAERHGLKMDTRYREWFQNNTQLSHIEGLVAYLESYPS